jgi:hypothetical protein
MALTSAVIASAEASIAAQKFKLGLVEKIPEQLRYVSLADEWLLDLAHDFHEHFREYKAGIPAGSFDEFFKPVKGVS